MRIVAGLGNPGSGYADTRHNVGFRVVEELARRWRLRFSRTRRGVRTAQGVFEGERVVLVEPQMYMNLSGDALARSEFPVAAAELIVIHDDLDLDCGRVRVKCGGGTAGHRGLDSVVERYGANFTRVRVGIGRPPRNTDATDYVLSAFVGREREVIALAIERAADAVDCILRDGKQAAMNSFNAPTSGGLPAAAAPLGRK